MTSRDVAHYIEVNERKFTKEEVKALDKPKKRGRPSSKKENK